MSSLQKDDKYNSIQGFAPREIMSSGLTLDVSDYIAVRFTESVSYTFPGASTSATVQPGTIIVCSHLNNITLDSSVVVELM